jgi:Bifunctional DNA primase/polymerase, N-terminal
VSELHEYLALYGRRALLLRGKRPMSAGWQHGQTSHQREKLLREHPSANVGVLTGDGLAVIDEDPRRAGDKARVELEAQYGSLPDTYRVLTGGGGVHYYLRALISLRSFELAPGLEVKGDGSQVVAPPSVHPDTGRLYVPDPSGPPFGMFAELPSWIALGPPDARPRSSARPPKLAEADVLLRIPAATYVHALAGRSQTRNGRVQCPFHKGGQERHPDVVLDGVLWCCWACPAPPGKRALGGGIYTFGALLWGYPLPLRDVSFLTVQDRLLDAMTAYLAGRRSV